MSSFCAKEHHFWAIGVCEASHFSYLFYGVFLIKTNPDVAAKSLSYTVHSVLLKDAVCMEQIMLPKSRFPVFVWLSLRDGSQGVSWKYVWVFFHCSIFDSLWVVMCTQKYVLQSDVIRHISQVFFKTVVLLVFWYLNFHYSHKLVTSPHSFIIPHLPFIFLWQNR